VLPGAVRFCLDDMGYVAWRSLVLLHAQSPLNVVGSLTKRLAASLGSSTESSIPKPLLQDHCRKEE
jgi:hypothetical protein